MSKENIGKIIIMVVVAILAIAFVVDMMNVFENPTTTALSSLRISATSLIVCIIVLIMGFLRRK